MLVRQENAYEKESWSTKGQSGGGDSNNRTAAHVHSNDHRINWDEARVLETESCYWKRRVLEVI